MAPLSGKQQREYLKFQNKEAREVSKMGLDEMRKQQLHELKLKEAAAKANQGLGYKQQVNNAKLNDMGVPLPKSASISKQKLGIPSMNPMAGTEMFKQGQHKLPQSTVFQAQGTDTVPAMLTPGEAVIPRAAAQNPKNKKAIKRMVQEGRKANMRDGAVDVRNSDAPLYNADGTSGVPSLAYRHPDVPGSSFMHGTMDVPEFSRGSSAQANYADGTERVFSRYGKGPLKIVSTHDGYPQQYDEEGRGMSEYSVTVTDPRINKGRPTNIPSLWEGKVLSEDKAILKALANGGPYPSYKSIPQAIEAAGQKSDSGGAAASYSNGSYGVVPQQVQSAAGYYDGTLDADIDEERKRQGQVPMIIQPTPEFIPIWDPRRAEEGERYANMSAVDNRPLGSPMAPAVPSVVVDSAPSNVVVTDKKVTLPPEEIKAVPAPNVSVVPAMPNSFKTPLGVAPVEVQAEPVVAPPAIVVGPLGPTPTELANALQIERDKANVQNTPVAVAVPEVPPKEGADLSLVSGLKKDYETDPVKASRKIRSVADIVQELSGTQKTEKSFTDSLANLFTASGFKEELGLNNQDIIRMAISTAVGGKRYGVRRALAYAGRQAFEESNKRNAMQQSDNKAIRAAAVQIHGQEIRDVRAEENALSAEKRAVLREDARREHDRFIANQQEKMRKIDQEFMLTRDYAKREQEMRVLAAQSQKQFNQLQATMGNQWAMMYAREELKNNSPQAKLERMEKHTDKAASAISEIYKRELGSEDVKDQPNPSRSGLPTPKQNTQQSLSYLKRSGFDITSADVSQEATALMNQATEQMIADKKSGRVKDIKDVTPYLARNIVTHRMGLTGTDPNLFNIGNKPMPPEKISEIYSLARRAASDKEGNIDQENLANGVNKLATVWNSPDGKKYREEFKGTDNETAFAQFLKSRLQNQLK